MGVKPSQVVDLKALIGDTSDNIPGIKGVGEKTAGKLLEQYPSLDEVYAHLAEIPGRTGKLLEEGKASAYLSYDLARIHTDLDVQLDLEQARTDNMDIPSYHRPVPRIAIPHAHLTTGDAAQQRRDRQRRTTGLVR